jgi:hypothetical protein
VPRATDFVLESSDLGRPGLIAITRTRGSKRKLLIKHGWMSLASAEGPNEQYSRGVSFAPEPRNDMDDAWKEYGPQATRLKYSILSID